MELAYAIRHIWRHKIWLVPVSIVAIFGALAVTYRISLVPPGLSSKSYAYGSATGQILIQPAQPAALARITASNVVTPEQAAVYASLLQSRPVRRGIGVNSGLPWTSIGIEGQVFSRGAEEETNAAQRSAQLVTQGRTLSLFFRLESGVPIISLYAQAPTPEVASRIVTGATKSLRNYVNGLQTKTETPVAQQVKFVKLGQPEAGTLAAGAEKTTGILVAILVFGAGCLLIVFVPRLALALRRAKATESGFGVTIPAQMEPPAKSIAANGGGHQLEPGLRHLSDGDD